MDEMITENPQEILRKSSKIKNNQINDNIETVD
jgi:hypothetical protein